MHTRIQQLQKVEFETRIFVSFALVAVVLAAAWAFFPATPTTGSVLVRALGTRTSGAHNDSFLVAAAIVAFATLLRMAAGSVLTSKRMMAFKVQSDALSTRGPYRLCRNPIYLADLVALLGFALVLPPIALLLPVLLFLHYTQIVRHEERALTARFGDRYRAYLDGAPRFFPTPRSLRCLPQALAESGLNRDGMRHNALYVLFLPGLLVGAHTGQFWHALVIGLPATVDWAIVHTRIGLTHDASAEAEVNREA